MLNMPPRREHSTGACLTLLACGLLLLAACPAIIYFGGVYLLVDTTRDASDANARATVTEYYTAVINRDFAAASGEFCAPPAEADLAARWRGREATHGPARAYTPTGFAYTESERAQVTGTLRHADGTETPVVHQVRRYQGGWNMRWCIIDTP